MVTIDRSTERAHERLGELLSWGNVSIELKAVGLSQTEMRVCRYVEKGRTPAQICRYLNLQPQDDITPENLWGHCLAKVWKYVVGRPNTPKAFLFDERFEESKAARNAYWPDPELEKAARDLGIDLEGYNR